MIVTYIARRSLYDDHVAGDEYTLDIGTTVRAMSRRAERVQQRSLSGRIETLWYYGERAWSITFEPIQGDKVLQLVEFLDSTESGEEFSMTLHGESEAAVGLKRTDDGYALQTFLDMGALTEDWFQASIEAVEQ